MSDHTEPSHAPDASLLTTKLYVPPRRPKLVPRTRLIQRLDEGLDQGRRLSVVSAPAGYGKTTLVAEWAHQPGIQNRVAWLTLDSGDNDPARFFAYLVAALQQVNAEIGQHANNLLEAPQMPPVELLVTELINDIGAVPPAPHGVVLVLEDYHTITELAIHEAIGLLLERQPPQMHLVITTRQDPPLPLSRLRGRGQVTEIRESDLRFAPDEAATFLRDSMGLDLTPGDIAALEARTEGWIAGLQMAAIALQAPLTMQDQDAQSATRLIAGFSGRHHFILDYLTDEVLKGQPEPVQAFLLQTSILERLTAPLCEAIVGQDGLLPYTSQSLLEYLDSANLFIVPLDEERQWYRYHRLFADLLRSRLQQQVGAEGLAPLHRRAADWCDQQGLAAQAVHHALATRDLTLAADVIERAVQRIQTWTRVGSATYLAWLQALPDDLVRSRPTLRLFASRALYATGQAERAERMLQELEDSLQADSEAPGAARLLDSIVGDRASFAAVRGDLGQAVAYARQLQARLPVDDALARIRPTAILGLVHLRAGDVSEASRAFSQVIATARVEGIEFAAGLFVCHLADVQLVQGQPRQAMQTFEEAMKMGTVEGQRTPATGFASLGMARILYEWNDLQAAEERVLEGLDWLRRGGIPASFGIGHALLAQVRQARGDPAGAQAAMQRAVQLAEGSNIPRISLLSSAYQARLWLAQDQVDRAIQWASNYRLVGPTEYLRDVEDLTLARVLLAQGDAVGAQALLDQLLLAALSADRMGRLIEIQALRALAVAETARIEQALEALERALRLAEPEGYVRLFIDEGEPMARLVYEAAAQGSAAAYARKLLEAFRAAEGEAPSALLQPPCSLIEPLTARELEVLQLLAEGLTNAEIARRLIISLPTVKSHTRNLYGKLAVHNRGEAVAQAQALGLLRLP